MATPKSKLEQLAEQLSTHFGDYIVMIRTKEGGSIYQLSNTDWALGAMRNLLMQSDARIKALAKEEALRDIDDND